MNLTISALQATMHGLPIWITLLIIGIVLLILAKLQKLIALFGAALIVVAILMALGLL